MSSEIKKLLNFLGIALLMILLIDFCIGSILDILYDRMEGGERARAHYVINKSNDDILIMGSSRAWNHYIPRVFEDTLGMTAYNAGRSAQSLLYQKTLLKMFLPRHKPKVIILDVNENDLVFEERKYEIFGSLIPYYKSSKAFRDEYDAIAPHYKYFGWLNSVGYNSALFSIFYRSLNPQKEVNKGFKALSGERVSYIKSENNCDDVIKIDQEMRFALREIIRLCKANDIHLICVFSPRTVDFECERIDYKEIRSELIMNQVDLIDFVTNKKFRANLNFMRDPAHLNGSGALEFSSDVAHLIKLELAN